MFSSWLGQGGRDSAGPPPAQPRTAQTTGQPPQPVSATALTEESQQLLLSGATHHPFYKALAFLKSSLTKHAAALLTPQVKVLNLHWQERMDSVSPLTFGDPRASGQAQLNQEGSLSIPFRLGRRHLSLRGHSPAVACSSSTSPLSAWSSCSEMLISTRQNCSQRGNWQNIEPHPKSSKPQATQGRREPCFLTELGFRTTNF